MQKCDVTIREAAAEDVAMLAVAEKEIFSDPWSEESFLSAVNAPWIHVYLIYFKGKFAGYITVSVLAGVDLNIDNIAVFEKFRRMGLAEYMIKYIIMTFENAECIQLEVREGNTAARKLYEKLGFYVNGKRPKYYTHPTEDAILMQLTLK